jgi:hypothetical protein
MKIRKFNENVESLDVKVNYLIESLKDFSESVYLEKASYNDKFELIEVWEDEEVTETYYLGYSIFIEVEIFKHIGDNDIYFDIDDMFNMSNDLSSIVQFVKSKSIDMNDVNIRFCIKDNLYVDIVDLKSKIEK